MSASISRGDPIRCPVCSTIYDDERSVCPRCGSIVPLEIFWRRAARSIRGFFGRTARARISTMLWLLAVSPFLIVPPLIAIGLALGPSAREKSKVERIAVVAISATNITLSAIALILIRHQLAGWALSAWDFLTHHEWTQPAPSDNPIQSI